MSDSALLQAFAWQSQWCAMPAPFTARALRRTHAWLRDDAAAHEALATVDTDPLAAAVPLRWAGGLHHLALRGLAPWAQLWPPAAPGLADAALDAALDHAVRAAWRKQQPAMRAALALPPQTNEVQRSAALLPGLLHVAASTGLPLALLEIGASAGLNLWCDRYRYAPVTLDGPATWSWGDAAAPLTLGAEWRGSTPANACTDLRVVDRQACDAHPVDLTQSGQQLRLASFVWPDQPERLTRLRAAMTAAARWQQQDGVAVEALPAASFVARELAAPSPGRATVLMHSVVWQYIAADQQAAIRAVLQAAAARATAQAPLAWLRLEPPAGDGKVELRCQLWPAGDDQLLARCHPHGAWIEWLAPAPAAGMRAPEPGAGTAR